MVKINREKWLSNSLFHPEQKKGENHDVHSCRRSPSCLRSWCAKVWKCKSMISVIALFLLLQRKVSVYLINYKQKTTLQGHAGRAPSAKNPSELPYYVFCILTMSMLLSYSLVMEMYCEL